MNNTSLCLLNSFSASESRGIYRSSLLTCSLHMLTTAGLNGSELLISVDVCEVPAKIVTQCSWMKGDEIMPSIHQQLSVPKNSVHTVNVSLRTAALVSCLFFFQTWQHNELSSWHPLCFINFYYKKVFIYELEYTIYHLQFCYWLTSF